MTEAELTFLKSSVDQIVEIETNTATVIWPRFCSSSTKGRLRICFT